MRSVYRFLRKTSTILYSDILPQAIYSDPPRGPRGNEILQVGQPIAFLAIISRFPRGGGAQHGNSRQLIHAPVRGGLTNGSSEPFKHV